MFEDLTLITCSYNTPDVIITMLKSFIDKHSNYTDKFNLLLMENSTDDKTEILLKNNNINYIKNENLSHHKAVNNALKICKTKYALLVDSDIIFEQSIHKLYSLFKKENITLMGDICGNRGGYLLKPRVHPWFCFINIENIKKYNIQFFDQKRIDETKSNDFYNNIPILTNYDNKTELYDVGSTFFEDIAKNNLKICGVNNITCFFKHYEGSSWHTKSNHVGFIELGSKIADMYKSEIEKYKNIDINNKFVDNIKEKHNKKVVIVHNIFCPNDIFLESNVKSITSMINYVNKYKNTDIDIDLYFTGWCKNESYWNIIKSKIGNNALIKLDKNYGKAYTVNNVIFNVKEYDYIFTLDSDIILDINQPNIFERLLICSLELKRLTNGNFGLITLNQLEDNCHSISNFDKNIILIDEELLYPSNCCGLAGGCLFIDFKEFKKINGYRLMGIYSGDDGYLMQDLFRNNKLCCMSKTISIIHPKMEQSDIYRNWKLNGVLKCQQSNGSVINIDMLNKEIELFNNGDII